MSKSPEYQSAALDRLATRLQRTVFVGGISLKSSTADIEAYLSQFDEVESVVLPRNKHNGLLRGYAKATLRSLAGVERLMSTAHHCIAGLNVGVSRWTTTEDYLERKKDLSSRKVYVKFKARIGVDHILAYFSTFGPIEQFDIKRNPLTGRFRDFGYLTFEHERSAREVVDLRLHTIGNEVIRCEQSKPNYKPGESWPVSDYEEAGWHKQSRFSDLRHGKLNNKILPTKYEGNRLEPDSPGLGSWKAQKQPHWPSEKIEDRPRRTYKTEQICKDFKVKIDSSSSDRNRFYQPNQKSEIGIHKFEAPADKSNPPGPHNQSMSQSAWFRYPPTSRHYPETAHEERNANHYKPENLRFMVRLPVAYRPELIYPQLQP